MLYLNDVEAGGTTDFPELELSIRPAAGMLLVWNNMDRRGRPNPATRHGGRPVEAGVKYIVTQWYRLEAWRLNPELLTAQAVAGFLRLRRPKTAAAPAPNRSSIGGAGTWVPEVVPQCLPQP